MNESENLYEILRVHPTAGPDVIQAAYRDLARIYNPALCNAPENKSLAETRTGQLNRAYAVLKDPVLRAAYDRTRAASGSPAGSSPPRGTDGQQPDGTKGGDVSQVGQHRAWTEEWVKRYFEGGRPLYQQLMDYARVQGLPVATKRGLCLVIMINARIGEVMKEFIFRRWGEGKSWRRLVRQKLPDITRVQIMQEIGRYACFQTIKQVWEYGSQEWEYGPDGKQREGYQEALDAFYYWSGAIYGMQECDFREYEQAKNHLEHVGHKIGAIAGTDDLADIVKACIFVATWCNFDLFEGNRRVYSLSEQEMTALIHEAFVAFGDHFVVYH